MFCRILDGQLPASFLFRDERIATFMDIQPVTPGHALVIPVAHAPYLADLDPGDGALMFQVGQRIAGALRSLAAAGGIRCEGVNLFLADGVAAGQEVFHAHLHVFPRFDGDGFGLKLPEDYEQLPPRDELDRLASMLRPGLPSAARGD